MPIGAPMADVGRRPSCSLAPYPELPHPLLNKTPSRRFSCHVVEKKRFPFSCTSSSHAVKFLHEEPGIIQECQQPPGGNMDRLQIASLLDSSMALPQDVELCMMPAPCSTACRIAT